MLTSLTTKFQRRHFRSIISPENQWPWHSSGQAHHPSITYFNLLLSASATWTPTRLSAYELSFFTINPWPPHSSQICHHIASSCAVKPAWQVNVTIHGIHISQKLRLCSQGSHWPFYYKISNCTGINIKCEEWLQHYRNGKYRCL